MANHSNIFAQESLWDRGVWGLQSIGSQESDMTQPLNNNKKYHRLGGLNKQTNFISHHPRSRCWLAQFPVTAHFLVYRQMPSHFSLTARESDHLSSISSFKGSNIYLHDRLYPLELPSKAPPPNTVRLKIRASVCALVGGGHKQNMHTMGWDAFKSSQNSA